MRIITFFNGKGGTGKTTTTVNVSAALKQLGYKVLIIDLDGQASATMAAGVLVPEGSNTIFDSLTSGAPLPILEGQTGLHVVPADGRMYQLELLLANEPDRAERLGLALEPVRDFYDFILIDCPPAFGLATINAIKYAESLVLVANMSLLTLRSTQDVYETLEESKRIAGKEKVLGVVLTMNRYTNENKTVFELVKKRSIKFPFRTCVRMSTYISEAAARGMDIFAYYPECSGASDYMDIAKELLERIQKQIDYEQKQN